MGWNDATAEPARRVLVPTSARGTKQVPVLSRHAELIERYARNRLLALRLIVDMSGLVRKRVQGEANLLLFAAQQRVPDACMQHKV